MPIYEYRCCECEKDFECLIIGSNDDICCPECDGNRVERLMSSCSFKSGGSYSAPSTSSGCSSCASSNCSTCH
jgi:putative FmdB family regulatory protein